MRNVLLCAVLLLSLSACGKQNAQPESASKSAKSSQSSARPKPKAKLRAAKPEDLLGHYFVDTQDHNRVLQFTASTSGYYLDVQTRQEGEDFASSEAGIFAAAITTKAFTYTVAGTAQPHAAGGTLQFKKLTNTKMQQLPDGPTYRRVQGDDLSTIE